MEVPEIFPRVRERRLRRTRAIRDLVSEVSLSPSNMIQPVFVRYGSGVVEEIASMPGVMRYSVDRVGDFIGKAMESGVRAFLLFGIPSSKDELGSGAYDEEGVIPTAIKGIRRDFPDAVVAADVCLCEYTSHGHCGIVRNGAVDNDTTLEYLARTAVVYARAGADIVAPSAMMDGQVKAIRDALDREGLKDTVVMGYSSKFASALYGPFREAAESTPRFGDRKSYQMDYRSWRAAMREIDLDIREGADIVMVKPAIFYLDIIRAAKERFYVPIAAYGVSGEYSMIRAAAERGWIDEPSVVLEYLHAIKRAGADIIITYYAHMVKELLERA